jgi:hypothetical protein
MGNRGDRSRARRYLDHSRNMSLSQMEAPEANAER